MEVAVSNNRWRVGVLIGAVALAFAAQYLYTGELFTHWKDSDTWTWAPRYTLASLFLLVTIGGAAWALAGHTQEKDDSLPPISQSLSAFLDETMSWLAVSIGCYLSALFIYWTVGENIAVQLLWVGAMIALVVPLWRQSSAQPNLEAVPWWQWAAVLALTGLGFILRYWHLTEIPSHVDNDVALMGTFGAKLIDTGNFNWIGASDSTHLLSYDQFLAWSMRLFGENHYGLVMSSVICGTLTLPLVFFLGRDMFNWRVGLIAMAFLAIDYTHIQFSRILFGPTSTLCVALTLCLLFRGLKTGQAHWYALSGLAAGFGLLVYDSGRIIPVIVIAIATWCLFWRPTSFLAHFKNWCLFALGLLIGFGPMLSFVFKDFDAFSGRGNVVTLWSPDVWQHEAEAYQLDNVGAVVLEQAKHTFLTFYLYGDGSPHFAFPRPMVAPLIAVLLTVGVGYSLWRIRDIRYFTLLVWIILTFILGGVLTYDPPYWPHLNIALPAVAIVAAVAADALIATVAPQSSVLVSLGLRVFGLSLVVYTGISNWQAYTAFVADNAGPRIRIARYIEQFPTDYQVYLVSDTVNWSEYAFQFFNRGVTGQNITADQLASLPPPTDKPRLYILMDHQDSVAELEKMYPQSQEDAAYASEGSEDPVFESLTVTPPNYVRPPH